MPSLKQRVEQIESELAELRQAVQRNQPKDWRRAVEKYADDDDLQAVFAAAMKLREADRKNTRTSRRTRKKPA